MHLFSLKHSKTVDEDNFNIFVNFSEYILANYELILDKKLKKFLMTEENLIGSDESMKFIW